MLFLKVLIPKTIISSIRSIKSIMILMIIVKCIELLKMLKLWSLRINFKFLYILMKNDF